MDSFIAKLKRGDKKAFEQLVRKNQNKIYAVCISMLKNPHDAQDAAQEAFVKAFRSLGAFREDSSVETWLTKIAINTCRDMLRKQRPTVDIDECYDAAAGETTEETADRRERIRAVRSALAKLPQDARELIVLRDIEGESYEAISDILGINLGTVRSRLSRAREKLKNILLDNRELF